MYMCMCVLGGDTPSSMNTMASGNLFGLDRQGSYEYQQQRQHQRQKQQEQQQQHQHGECVIYSSTGMYLRILVPYKCV